MTSTDTSIPTVFRGNARDVKSALAAHGIRYGIAIGRRAPMHRVHKECLYEIVEAGLQPVIIIGSTNGPESPLFDPLSNPLTLAQQKEQLAVAVPELYDARYVFSLPDQGHAERWLVALLTRLKPARLAEASVVHYRVKTSEYTLHTNAIQPLPSYMAGFSAHGILPWESFNRDPVDDTINASDLRRCDLQHLTSDTRAWFAAPEYLINLATQARADNPDRLLLADVPVTMLDLTFDRLRKERHIPTRMLVQRTSPPLTWEILAQSVSRYLHKNIT